MADHDVSFSPDPLPWKYAFLGSVHEPNTVVQGSWAKLASNWTEAGPLTINNGYGYSQSGSGVANDEIRYKVPLSAGTWKFVVYARRSTNTGILTLTLDGVSVGTSDTYNASADLQASSFSGVAVGSNGIHTLGLLMATKNASSSGFLLNLLAVDLTRTA